MISWTFETFLVLLAISIGLATVIFWGSMIVHCFRNKELNREVRVLWLVALVLGKLVGAGAYYFLKYRRRMIAPAVC